MVCVGCAPRNRHRSAQEVLVAAVFLSADVFTRRSWLRQEVRRYEREFHLFADPAGATRSLLAMREELTALDHYLGAAPGAEPVEPPRYELTPAQAALRVGMSRGVLLDRVERTPRERRPCIDKSTGGSRRHLRFDRAQLSAWAKERPWQASDPMPEAGCSDGASPTPVARPGGSSGHGSAPAPRPRRRSTGRRQPTLSVVVSAGVPLTGDPDLDALV